MIHSHPVSEPLPSASAIAQTKSGEVVLIRRSAELPVLGGYGAFPGGGISEEDRALALGGGPLGPARTAALRELLEETGLLLDGDRLRAVPDELRDAGLTRAIAALGAKIDPERLVPAVRFITPDLIPIRFDTQFF